MDYFHYVIDPNPMHKKIYRLYIKYLNEPIYRR